VLSTVTGVYVASAIVTTVIVLLTSRRLVDEQRPATHRLSLAVAAGLVWPLLLLGVVEFGSVMVYSKLRAPDHGEAGIAVMA
jgi:hypothetical protein